MKLAYILALCAGTTSPGICRVGDDVDFVSDLNGSGDATVAVHENESVHGADAVDINGTRKPVDQPKSVDQAKKIADPADDKAKPLSLRDQISSALKGEDATPPAASQDGRVRNPDGTFAAKPADPAAIIDPAAAPAGGTTTVAAPAGIDPEVFKSLPAETQASLARTMDGIAQSQERFARLEPIEQLLAPRREYWALNRMSDAQALGQLLALSDFATRDAPGFVKYFAENNGVNLEDLVFRAEPVDPAQKASLDRIAALEGHIAQATQQQREAAHRQVVDSVAAFASEKAQDGTSLLRPHFEELGTAVLPFISAIKAQNPGWSHNQVLQEAYDQACWGTPSVRSKMLAAQDAAREAERLRTGAAKAEQARSASASVKTGAPTATAAAPADASRSLRDTIKASMSAANG